MEKSSLNSIVASQILTAADLAALEVYDSVDTSGRIELASAAGENTILIPFIINTVVMAGELPAASDFGVIGFKDSVTAYDLYDSIFVSNKKVNILPFGFVSFFAPEIADVANMPLILQCVTPVAIPGGLSLNDTEIGAAGTGYVEDDELTVGDATITVLSVGAGGEVETYEITDPGSAGVVGDGQVSTGGTGTGFTLDVAYLDYSVNPLRIKIEVIYHIFNLTQ